MYISGCEYEALFYCESLHKANKRLEYLKTFHTNLRTLAASNETKSLYDDVFDGTDFISKNSDFSTSSSLPYDFHRENE